MDSLNIRRKLRAGRETPKMKMKFAARLSGTLELYSLGRCSLLLCQIFVKYLARIPATNSETNNQERYHYILTYCNLLNNITKTLILKLRSP